MDITVLQQTDPGLYADMAAYLQAGSFERVYESRTALWLKQKQGHLHAIAALDRAEAEVLLFRVPTEDALVLRGISGLRELAEAAGFNGCEPCWQVCYPGKIRPVQTALTIRHPDAADFDKVCRTYHMESPAELRKNFDSPDFLGAYLDGDFVGYIGLHSDGSMGLLYIFPAYRRRGFAEALYQTLINRQLEQGRLPFAQIVEHNTASLGLQRKLGFHISRELVYWLWRQTPEQSAEKTV